MASPPSFVSMVTPMKRLHGVSKPSLAVCDDLRFYAVKGVQVGRTLIADQVVGRLGALNGAPVAEVGLVDVPNVLIKSPLSARGTSTGSIVHFSPGVGHGAVWIPNCTDSREIEHEDDGDNRDRFALLAVLHGWTGADDRQLLYENQRPRHVHSVDHGYFFGGPDWTIDSLAASPPPTVDQWITRSSWIDAYRVASMITRLRLVQNEAIAAAIATPPETWDVTVDERVALAIYSARRRDALLELNNGR